MYFRCCGNYSLLLGKKSMWKVILPRSKTCGITVVGTQESCRETEERAVTAAYKASPGVNSAWLKGGVKKISSLFPGSTSPSLCFWLESSQQEGFAELLNTELSGMHKIWWFWFCKHDGSAFVSRLLRHWCLSQSTCP